MLCDQCQDAMVFSTETGLGFPRPRGSFLIHHPFLYTSYRLIYISILIYGYWASPLHASIALFTVYPSHAYLCPGRASNCCAALHEVGKRLLASILLTADDLFWTLMVEPLRSPTTPFFVASRPAGDLRRPVPRLLRRVLRPRHLTKTE